jgi:hypothetical protein
MPNLKITRDVILRTSFRLEGHPKNKDVASMFMILTHLYKEYLNKKNIRVYMINYQGGTLVILLWMNYCSSTMES